MNYEEIKIYPNSVSYLENEKYLAISAAWNSSGVSNGYADITISDHSNIILNDRLKINQPFPIENRFSFSIQRISSDALFARIYFLENLSGNSVNPHEFLILKTNFFDLSNKVEELLNKMNQQSIEIDRLKDFINSFPEKARHKDKSEWPMFFFSQFGAFLQTCSFSEEARNTVTKFVLSVFGKNLPQAIEYNEQILQVLTIAA